MKSDVTVWGDVDMCEALPVAAVCEMLKGKEVNTAEIPARLDYFVSLIKTVFAPYDGEYRIVRFGSHIAVDRNQKIGIMPAESRLLVVGLR